jgi:hypothetical protein
MTNRVLPNTHPPTMPTSSQALDEEVGECDEGDEASENDSRGRESERGGDVRRMIF